MARRPFGSLRRLPSGRWQASYWWEGARHTGQKTFGSKSDASAWLSTVEADVRRGNWVDPRAGLVSLEEYSRSWLRLRTDLRPRTRELYESILARHILPNLGRYELGALTPSVVRAWYASLSSEGGLAEATVARSYRVLRVILNTAVADEMILRNPCRVKGGGVEHSEERPVLSIAQVHALADAIEPKLRCLVLLAAYCSLRRGEPLGLTRADVDLVENTVSIRRSAVEVGGRLLIGPPKTAAGTRVIALPELIWADMEAHLELNVGASPDSFLFVGERGGPLRTKILQREWDRVRSALGVEHVHLHDLRHSGNTWAAATGASTAELMARMGHASALAALRYQHATRDRDRDIASALSKLGADAVSASSQVMKLSLNAGTQLRGHD